MCFCCVADIGVTTGAPPWRRRTSMSGPALGLQVGVETFLLTARHQFATSSAGSGYTLSGPPSQTLAHRSNSGTLQVVSCSNCRRMRCHCCCRSNTRSQGCCYCVRGVMNSRSAFAPAVPARCDGSLAAVRRSALPAATASWRPVARASAIQVVCCPTGDGVAFAWRFETMAQQAGLNASAQCCCRARASVHRGCARKAVEQLGRVGAGLERRWADGVMSSARPVIQVAVGPLRPRAPGRPLLFFAVSPPACVGSALHRLRATLEACGIVIRPQFFNSRRPIGALDGALVGVLPQLQYSPTLHVVFPQRQKPLSSCSSCRVPFAAGLADGRSSWVSSIAGTARPNAQAAREVRRGFPGRAARGAR